MMEKAKLTRALVACQGQIAGVYNEQVRHDTVFGWTAQQVAGYADRVYV